MNTITINIEEDVRKGVADFIEKYKDGGLPAETEKIIYALAKNIDKIIIESEKKPYEITQPKNNTIAVNTTYEPWLISKFKGMGGKWDKVNKTWNLKNVKQEEIEEILDGYFNKVPVELVFEKGTEITGHYFNFEFSEISLIESKWDEYGRIDSIILSKDVTLVSGNLPHYAGRRKGHGELIFEESCTLRVSIPKNLLTDANLVFDYGEFKILE
jgi:hypothetical protein